MKTVKDPEGQKSTDPTGSSSLVVVYHVTIVEMVVEKCLAYTNWLRTELLIETFIVFLDIHNNTNDE